MRACDAFFLLSVPDTVEGRVGRADDLVYVYYTSIFLRAGTFVASPLVHIEVTVGLRRTSSRVCDHRAIRCLEARADGIQPNRAKREKQRTNDRAHEIKGRT